MKIMPPEETHNFPFDMLENYMKRVSDRWNKLEIKIKYVSIMFRRESLQVTKKNYV